jgi:hypothetical protein
MFFSCHHKTRPSLLTLDTVWENEENEKQEKENIERALPIASFLVLALFLLARQFPKLASHGRHFFYNPIPSIVNLFFSISDGTTYTQNAECGCGCVLPFCCWCRCLLVQLDDDPRKQKRSVCKGKKIIRTKIGKKEKGRNRKQTSDTWCTSQTPSKECNGPALAVVITSS